MNEYEHEKQTKKRLIRASLNHQYQIKHLKFDSDTDNEDKQPKLFFKNKIQLFNDNDILNIEEHFNDKHISKKRNKLQNLQANLKITNDSRFQLNEQFLDDKMDRTNNHENSMEEEKQKSPVLLHQIKNAKSSTSKFKTQMIRFDPSKVQHKIYELNSDSDTSTNNLHISNRMKTKSILKQAKPIM